MYGDYGNHRITDYDENYSQANGFPPEKSPLQRSQSISSRPTAKSIYQQRKAYAQELCSTDDLIQYHVEHLTTCDLDSNNMTSVDHCITKLKLLHAKGKIWGQDMLLQLIDTSFKMVDIETKDDLELFPIDAIQDSQAILNSCICNSLLALTIRDKNKRKTSVYMFQCEEVSADLIQTDIEKMIRGTKVELGKQDMLRNNLESMLPQHSRPPYGKSAMTPPPERWISPDYDKPPNPAMSEHGSWAEQQSRTPSEYGTKISNDDALMAQRNTEILNHVLDDLEKFNDKITEAIGSKEQKKKKKKKKKSKKNKELLPPKEEFEDCLQKIKYAFNLLSNLQDHLDTPSAADLVHVLFQILEFILSYIPSLDLAQNLITPFLIPPAIEFLASNTTAEEKEIWTSLGDAWNVSRSDWPNGDSFPKYIPTFYDGWEPPALQPLRAPTPNQSQSLERGHPREQMEDPRGAPFERSQKDPQFARAMYDFVKRNTRELSVMKGDFLEVLEATKQWWKVRNSSSHVGYVPSNIMQLVNREEPRPSHVNNPRGLPYSPYADACDLTVHSTPREVTTWLQMKDFSRLTVKSLGVLSGPQLLSLTKEEMKMISGNEGDFVYNEIHRG
uniref:epidermal growth factor receptor kinase substrate 8-like protein 3b n=1 Tax=Pristiophorus japonicus TaxID=55135 RepID=UPI00398F7732